MKPTLVRDTVEAFIGGKYDDIAAVREGLGSARKAILRMINAPESQPYHIKPTDIMLGDLIEYFVAPPGSAIRKKYQYNCIESLLRSEGLQAVSEAISASSDFNTLFTKLIHRQFMPAYESMVDDLTPLYMETDSDNRIQFHGGLIDVDEPELTREGEPAAEGKPQEKYVEIENFKLTRQTGITEETILYDKTGGQIMMRLTDLGEAVGRQRRRYILRRVQDLAYTDNHYNLSANTTFKYGGSTAAIFSNDHSSIDTQTNDNTIGSANTVTTENMSSANQALRDITDVHGRKLSLRGDTLLVGTDNEFAAAELANSTQKFDSSDNAINPVRVLGLIRNIVADPEVTSSTWYWGNFRRQYVLQWVKRPMVDRLGPKLDSGVVAAFRHVQIYGFGARDYRFVVKAAA